MLDNPNNWRGMFYFNKDDYRIIVPKQEKALGWTLNWAQPKTYLFLLTVAFCIVSFVLIFN